VETPEEETSSRRGREKKSVKASELLVREFSGS